MFVLIGFCIAFYVLLDVFKAMAIGALSVSVDKAVAIEKTLLAKDGK